MTGRNGLPGRPGPLLALLALAVACNRVDETPPTFALPAPPQCTMEARPAITVEPIDTRTGRPAIGEFTLILRDGEYSDTTRAQVQAPPGITTISGAFERPGMYTVILRSAGYKPWQRPSVNVTRDSCHVRTERVRAELTPR